MVTVFDTRFNPPFPVEPSEVFWLIDPFTLNLIEDLSKKPRFKNLGVTIIDLSHRSREPGIGGFTTFAGWNMRKEFFVASMMKIGAMFATFMLRENLTLAMNEVSSGDKSEVLELVTNDWREVVENAVPAARADFPQIERIFEITGGKGDWRLRFATDEWKHMLNMIGHSDNHSASVIIDRVGYQYLNGALAAVGLYEPGNGGMWLGSNYAGRNWKKEPVSNLTHMGATAHHLAKFLTLLESDQLVSAVASKSMREIMATAGSWFDEGLRRARRAPSAGYYKIGLAGTAHDCGVVERTKGGKTVRYAAAVIGASDPQIIRDLIVKLDDYVFATEADFDIFAA